MSSLSERDKGFSAFVATLAQHSQVLGDAGLAQSIRLASAAENILAEARASQQPVLYIYGSDGWSCNMAFAHSLRLGSSSVQRSGKTRAEFLLERALLKTIDSQHRVSMVAKITPPRSMSAGKSGWSIWQAALDYHPFLREVVGGCFAIWWYLQDGLHFGGMRRRMLARHSMYYDLEAADGEDDDGGGLSREKDLCITWKCSSHVTSNAIKWALDTATSEQIIDDLSIGILSLINASEEILKKVDEFVATRVVWNQPATSVETRSALWRWLGVSESLLPAVMEVNPVWLPGESKLSVSSEQTAAGHEKVAAVVTYFMSWRRFSLTRWAGVTVSCQRLIRSLLIGLNDLCKMVFKDGNAYNLHGFKRVGNEARQFTAVGSLGVWAIERFALELLEDDRLLLRASSLRSKLERDACDTKMIPAGVWAAVAEVVDRPSIDCIALRDLSLHCLFVGLGYMHMHIFAHVGKYPFKLTQGNIDDDIKSLLADEGVHEFNSVRIRSALLLGGATG